MIVPPKDPWEILPAWQSTPNDRRFDLTDRTDIEDFLRPFKFDLRLITRMRDLLAPTDPVGRFTDDEVIETIAWRLSTRELVLREPRKGTTGPASGGGGSEQGAPQPEIDAAPAAAAPSSDEPDPDTLGDSDAQAQAAALTAASAQGSPLVQQCQPPKQPQPPPPPPPPKPLPGNLLVTVTDSKTGKVIEGAKVDITGPESKSDTTPATGKVAFNRITPGSYTANASKDGYAPNSGAATVRSSATTPLTVQLTPATVSLTVAGVAAGDKVTVGGLIVRNFDNNHAPRKKITISAVSPAGVPGKVTFQCDSAKVKFYDSAAGGSAIAIDGAANVFAPGSLPKDLYAEGVDFSASMRDIKVWLDFGSRTKVDSATLTVLWVDQPTVRLSGTISANNSKKNAYKGWTKANTLDLGLQEYNATMGARIGWGSEASAKVHPTKFKYPGNDLKLERDYDYHDYNGNTVMNSGSRSATIPPGNDTGPPQARDDDPDPDDTIYDFDAAGLAIPNAAVNTIHRTRNDFWAFASITVEGKAVRCSQVREYFIDFSQVQTAAPSGAVWRVKDPPDVAGDKQAGNGPTKLTWDLM